MQDAEGLIINTRGFARSMTAEACLLRLAELGFRHFEVALAHGHLWPGDMDAEGCLHFRRFVAGQRLNVASLDLSGNADIICAEAAKRSRTPDLSRRAFELAAALGVEGVVVTLGGDIALPDNVEWWKNLLDALGRLAEAAVSAGTALRIANAHASTGMTADSLVDLIEALGDAPVGAVLDVGLARDDIAMAAHRLGHRLKGIRIRMPMHVPQGRLAQLPALLDRAGPATQTVLDISQGLSDADLDHGVRRLVAAGLGRHSPAADSDEGAL